MHPKFNYNLEHTSIIIFYLIANSHILCTEFHGFTKLVRVIFGILYWYRTNIY